VALVRTNASKEISAYIITVTRIGELGTTFLLTVLRLLVTAILVPSSLILVTMMMEFLRNVDSFKSHRHNIPEDVINV
jgi:hypothetical protein